MNVDTIRAVHRYGAVLSVVGLAVALLAFLVGGPLAPLGPPLAFLTPLCGFYFVGAVLQHGSSHYVLGEELLRGVVWYGGSLLGWAVLLTSSSSLPVTPFTAFGLPVLTALGICLLLVGVRRATGLDLTVQTDGGRLLVLITADVVLGFVFLYLVLVGGRSPVLLVAYALAVVVGVLVWRRHRGREHAAS